MCSGKIYFDLFGGTRKSNNDKVVFIRIEQLYPFPAKTLAKVLKKYKNAEFLWCQEEPKNMGAWNTVRNYIDRTLEIIELKIKKLNILAEMPHPQLRLETLINILQNKKILEKVVGKSK